MIRSFLFRWRGGFAGAAFFLAATAASAGDPIPVQAFFEKPELTEADISPSGRHIALGTGGKGGTGQLYLADLDTQSLAVTPVSKVRYADVMNPVWINDRRIAFGVADTDRIGTRSAGVFAVDRDGSGFKILADVKERWRYFAGTTMGRDSDFIYELEPHQERKRWWVDLVKVNSRSGEDRKFDSPGDVVSWVLDPHGEPVFAKVRVSDAKVDVLYRNPASTKWERLATIDVTTGLGGFDPLALADDGTAYVVLAKDDGVQGLYTYDLKSRTISAAPLVAAKGFDIEPQFIYSSKGLLGVRFTTDAETTVWSDPEMQALQARLDKLLPGTVNRIGVPFRAEVPVVLVHSFSDREPGEFFIYDTQQGKLVEIGRTRPAIDVQRMGVRDLVRYKARDGLEIPAWITIPKDGKKGPRPTVMLVHGGPWLRGGTWTWNAEAQFLASRGYVVVEPEFRGSKGYGFNHFKAGWKQWGLAMQDDIADGARWAVENGYADPQRICIAGASYGGYATLMGLVKDGAIYQCGFEWAGVTDLDKLFFARWHELDDEWKTYGLPILIGDPDDAAEALQATSPVSQAGRIKRPLLMGYGERDRIVPISHGRRMRSVLADSNHDVEWAVYSDEGHGWSQLKTNVDWWTRVEKFLARNIGAEASRAP